MNGENNKDNLLCHKEVHNIIALALAEDHVDNDLTTQASNLKNTNATAQIIAKSSLITAGAELIAPILNLAAHEYGCSGITAQINTTDGKRLTPGQVWFSLTGPAHALLKVERTLLNFLIRACGIATTTNQVVELVAGTDCKVLHTRKTAPGHRRIDVYATLCGGAHAHRLHLADAILVKENHLRGATSFGEVFDGIQKLRSVARFVEIEVTNLTELKHALAAKPDRIMLDNFTVEECQKAVMLFGSAVELEASGGITLENAKAYADTGVNYISMGWITHSAPAADLSMLFKVN